jgi:hypothetical protein
MMMQRVARRVSFALIGLALVFVPGAASAGTAAVGPLVLVSGPSPYETCTVGAGTGTVFVNAEVEPQIASDPTNPKHFVGAFQQDRWSNGGAHGLAAAATFDSGKSWIETTLPFSRCATGGLNFERASDPWVSIGRDGIVYANALSFDRTSNRNAVATVRSTNGGKTWTNLVVLVDFETNGGQFSTDKNSVTADPGRNGVAYAVWDTLIEPTDNPDDNPHAAAFTGPAFFSKTTDGGVTWSTPRIILNTSNRQQTIGNIIVVDPRNGIVYDFTDLIQPPNTGSVNANATQGFNVAFIKSTDGGATWSAPQIVAAIVNPTVTDPNTGQLIRTGDIIPEPAIDPATGQLYVVWQDSRFTSNPSLKKGVVQVAFSTSTNGGATWSAPQPISTASGRPAFTPTVSVNSAGVVGVTYYDFRNLQAGNTTTLPTDYWFTSSADHGKSFGNEVHLAGSFDMLTAPFARGFFVGDYEGLTASGGVFHPFFVQANSGNTANRTDVFATSATP